MNRTTCLLAALVSWSAAGCVPTELTGGGRRVRVGKADPTDHCTELGVVDAGRTRIFLIPRTTSTSSARNSTRTRRATGA
jgi:hypothetical protein